MLSGMIFCAGLQGDLLELSHRSDGWGSKQFGTFLSGTRLDDDELGASGKELQMNTRRRSLTRQRHKLEVVKLRMRYNVNHRSTQLPSPDTEGASI